MDIVMKHQEAKEVVDRIGWNGWMENMDLKHPHLELYTCSKDWYEDSRYVGKFKGVKGDLIVSWE